ncbi:hypothetical protein BDV06DRAFT_228335 [Aspergillus oleicola]
MADNSQPRQRKPNSEKRKLQNRIASQIYRRRRRQKLALFDQLRHVLPPDEGFSTARAAPDFPVPEADSGPSLEIERITDVSDHATGAEPCQNSTALAPGPMPRSPQDGLFTSSSTILPVDLGLDWSLPYGHFDDEPSNSAVDPFLALHLDRETEPHTTINVQHLDRISQIVATLSFLSLSEKRQLLGLLSAEINADPELGGPDQALDPSAPPLPLFARPETHQESQTATTCTPTLGQSLSIHTEVTRYGRWLRRHIFSHPHLPDPQLNTLRIQHSSFYAAILANSRAIFLVNNEVLKEDSQSPYSIDHATGHKPADLPSARETFNKLIPHDLRPTDPQFMHPHHPYIDVIPFPSFRHRMIAAVTADPPLIDETEMCADMDAEAFICWGGMGRVQGSRTSGGSCEAEGYGDMGAEVPWDMRSWEPQVWFLRKYWFLVGGWDDEMWKNARWWAGMRGETISFR